LGGFDGAIDHGLLRGRFMLELFKILTIERRSQPNCPPRATQTDFRDPQTELLPQRRRSSS
jgi:hypothetical protein